MTASSSDVAPGDLRPLCWWAVSAACAYALWSPPLFGQSRPAQGSPPDDMEIPVQAVRPAAATPPTPEAPPAVSPTAPSTASVGELDELRESLRLLRERIARLESAPTPATVISPTATSPASTAVTAPTESPSSHATPESQIYRLLDSVGLHLSGYVQLQETGSQLSQDQLQPGGAPFNQDRFDVRRARIRLDWESRYLDAAITVEGNTMHGPAFGVVRAEGSFVLRQPSHTLPPYLRVTAGLTDIPFGYELSEPAQNRVFMERTLASRAFFAGETDIGVRVAAALGYLRGSVAVMNGTPISIQPGSETLAPTAGKDIIARVGMDTGVSPTFRLSGGVSFLYGTGFHPGTQATQNEVAWRDLNGNGQVDPGEVVGVPGQAATPSVDFTHWALNADVQMSLHTVLGWSTLQAEVTIASNLDRTMFVADPVAAGTDFRELGWSVGFVQEVTRYGLVGLRYEYYDPNADFLDSRRGVFVPTDESLSMVSPLVGLVWPGRARLVFQYDFIGNSLGRDARGVPDTLAENQWTARLQMVF